MIPYGKHHLDEDDIAAVVDVLRHGWLTQGPKIEEFENAIADYVGAKYAVAVSSGTAGLHIAALAAGMQPGDALLTTPITFVASANAGIYAGGKVLFADVDPETINLAPSSVETAVAENDNIKVIVPVHFAGLPCEMEEIKRSADRVDAVIIEDAAHALGASYLTGEKVGSCINSLMTVFSFHPVKAIAAGEGGMITTNDEPTYRKLLRLRSHGINKQDDPFQLPENASKDGLKNPWYYEMQEIGFNYRITDIQCALGISQFGKLDRFINRRVALANRYDNLFSDFKYCSPIQAGMRNQSGNHLYVLRINFSNAGLCRAELMNTLMSRGIGSQVHYIPVPSQPYYQRLGHDIDLYPIAQNYYNEALTIPLNFDLSETEQDMIVNELKELVG